MPLEHEEINLFFCRVKSFLFSGRFDTYFFGPKGQGTIRRSVKVLKKRKENLTAQDELRSLNSEKYSKVTALVTALSEYKDFRQKTV